MDVRNRRNYSDHLKKNHFKRIELFLYSFFLLLIIVLSYWKFFKPEFDIFLFIRFGVVITAVFIIFSLIILSRPHFQHRRENKIQQIKKGNQNFRRDDSKTKREFVEKDS